VVDAIIEKKKIGSYWGMVATQWIVIQWVHVCRHNSNINTHPSPTLPNIQIGLILILI